ncbi:MAG: phenylalanine--tRNA ligase subunit beta, partial [Bacilli bacterium]|nr:phenylalanine--tRNA ligase subunit beta [Bacilli bacterium]MDD6388791.1 phenylalanine--tRNA ligase subunit beta [Bacilli bacterium]
YPSISKDLSFVMKKDVESKIIKSQIKKSGTRLLTNVSEFDVYIGENVKDDEKSIAYNLTFNDPTRTLNDNEINEIIDRIVKDVEEKCNATLRR